MGKHLLLNYEKKLWSKKFDVVCGVDEVGRGALAGPLVASGVVWKPQILTWKTQKSNLWQQLTQINDSKKISAKKRETLSFFIIKHCYLYAIIEIKNTEIDKNGVGEANKKALMSAVLEIHKKTTVNHVLSDYFSVFSEKLPSKIPRLDETAITKGDQKSLSIASASIIAKVYRDNLMKNKFHRKYPLYGFDTNVGYGTKKHILAIKKYGLTPIHRKSFTVAKAVAKDQPGVKQSFSYGHG